MGQTASCLEDTWSAINNPGGLSIITQPSFAVGIERSPALPGANRMAAVIGVPLSFGTSAFGISRFGDELYSEQRVSIAFANSMGLASLGARISYLEYRSEGFGSKGVFSLAFGGIATLTPGFSVGAEIINLNQPTLSAADAEQLPADITIGAAYKPEKQFMLSAEIEKGAMANPLLRAGMEYEPNSTFSFRSGFSFNPKAAFVGIGVSPGRWHFGYGYEHLFLAPGRHTASIEYRFKK